MRGSTIKVIIVCVTGKLSVVSISVIEVLMLDLVFPFLTEVSQSYLHGNVQQPRLPEYSDRD